MGAQDRTEEVLRNIHVLFSKAQPYENSKKKIIVDKDEVMELLSELNSCMYDMMDEYELTKQSRDKAHREAQKQGDEIIFGASRKAEDIYAASIMYTDNALSSISDIIKEATDSVAKVYQDTQAKMREERRLVKENQVELKGQLQNLIDTQKYLHLIDEENLRLLKEKEEQSDQPADKPNYAAMKPEIKINKEYFAQAGISLGEEESEEEKAQQSMLSEDLDKEYFDWKDGEESQEKGKKTSGFSFFGKNK